MRLLILMLVLICSQAMGQSARVIQLPSGKYIGLFRLPSGEVVYLDDVSVERLPVTKPISEVAVVAFVNDNETTDIKFNGEILLAVRELRETLDSVVHIDDTPSSVQTIKQGKAIIEEARKVGLPAIVLIGKDGKAIRSTKMPATRAEMVRWVKNG